MEASRKFNVFVFSVCAAALFFAPALLLPAVQNFIVLSAEKYLVHRPLVHEVWFSRFNAAAIEIAAFSLCLALIKVFSTFFAEKTRDSFLNLLRVLACLMVWLLHTYGFTSAREASFFQNPYLMFLRTPAWGGVWIFFVLGGYLAGKGFADGRHSFDKKGLLKYYAGRLAKIILPTYAFIFFCLAFFYPSLIKENPKALLRLLTLSYGEELGVEGIGAAWYVFTAIRLYALAPFLSFAAIKAARKKGLLAALCALAFVFGFCLRLLLVQLQFDWFKAVYIPFYANLDLFFGGILLSQIVPRVPQKFKTAAAKDLALFFALFFVLINSYAYEKLFFHRVFCPSIYLLLCGLLFCAFGDEKWPAEHSSAFERALAFFSSITFEFYLFHSLVLHSIGPALEEKNLYLLHFELLALGFAITFVSSVAFKRVFEKKRGL